MTGKSKSYDEYLSRKFNDLKFSQDYLLHIVNDEQLSISAALRETIEAMGMKEFASKAGLSIQAVSNFVNEQTKWSIKNLSKHIWTVFKLEIKITIKDPRK